MKKTLHLKTLFGDVVATHKHINSGLSGGALGILKKRDGGGCCYLLLLNSSLVYWFKTIIQSKYKYQCMSEISSFSERQFALYD